MPIFGRKQTTEVKHQISVIKSYGGALIISIGRRGKASSRFHVQGLFAGLHQHKWISVLIQWSHSKLLTQLLLFIIPDVRWRHKKRLHSSVFIHQCGDNCHFTKNHVHPSYQALSGMYMYVFQSLIVFKCTTNFYLIASPNLAVGSHFPG